VESQAAEAAGRLAAHLDRWRVGKRTSIERFFGWVLVFFRLQRPPVFGWSAVETCVALTYAVVWVIALTAWQAGRPDLIRSPRLLLAHVWEGMEV
jgi:hypothetical protein